MKQRKKNAFTLIELIATLVIMAIIALIATPLVMSIIRKAKVSADKRSIDAYGRSIELAIAGYLMDNGSFPTSIEQLTIEYSGDEVVCSTTQLNSDSSIYLSGCRVAGRLVDYIYGVDKLPKAYRVGDIVTYNNIDYYVIQASELNDSTVTLLKAEPLSFEEVNDYGIGHVNMNVRPSETYYQIANDENGYGGMKYYSSPTCGYVNNEYVNTECKNDYASSDVKYVVDAWKTAQAPAATEARLITVDELVNNLGYESQTQFITGSTYHIKTISTPNWVYSTDYSYWTMTPEDDSKEIWYVLNRDGLVASNMILHTVRPVIVLPKSALSS